LLENLILGISMTLSQHVKELLDQFFRALTATCIYLWDKHIARSNLLVNEPFTGYLLSC
jgi:hypothetical protein